MKKIINTTLLLSLLLGLTGCAFLSGIQGNLKEVVASYQTEMNHILEEQTTSFDQENQLWMDYPRDQMYSKSNYLKVYNVQRDNSLDVQLDSVLSKYKEMLDETSTYLAEYDIESAKANIQIDVSPFGMIDIEVFVSSKGTLVFILDTNNPDFKRYAVKLGYENDEFYVREFIQYTWSNVYSYFEFLENNYVINVRFSSNGRWYRYQNQNDSTYYEYSEDLLNGKMIASTIRWYNPETKIRTTISDAEQTYHLIEFFNPKGIHFSYMNYIENNKIELMFQLLEASGWTSAFATYTNHPERGVYNNGVKLFDENVRINAYINQKFAHVAATLSVSNVSLITPQLLDLSMYGLTFNHPEITMDVINSTLNNTLEDSKALQIYRGIDFTADDVDQQLYKIIDKDLKP